MPAVDVERLREEAEITAANTRSFLAHYTKRAAEILQELAEYGDNDRVRLSAANSILDRAGVVAPTQIHVTADPQEHDLVRAEAEKTLADLQRNIEHRSVAPAAPKSIEAVIIHEGDDEPT